MQTPSDYVLQHGFDLLELMNEDLFEVFRSKHFNGRTVHCDDSTEPNYLELRYEVATANDARIPITTYFSGEDYNVYLLINLNNLRIVGVSFPVEYIQSLMDVENTNKKFLEMPLTFVDRGEQYYDDSLISKLEVVGDDLVITTDKDQKLVVPCQLLPGVSQLSKDDLLDFEVVSDGAYVTWPKHDIHYNVESLRLAQPLYS